ncbi:MAG TPA: chemotaxis protein CheW [Gallionella sp.]
MRELFLATFDGVAYGIWKDEIRSVREMAALHRIPLTPDCIAGIMIEDGRSVTLADLPVCIGYDATRMTAPGCILLKQDADRTVGFVVSGELRTLAVAPEMMFPLPAYLRTAVFDSCAVHDGVPIPLVNLAELHDRVLDRGGEPAEAALLPAAPQADAPERVRLISCGGERYAVSSHGVEDSAMAPGAITPLPGTPGYVRGVAFHNGRLLTVIDLSQRLLRRRAPDASRMLVARLGDGVFGFLIDGDGGSVPAGEDSLRPVPAIVQTPWLKRVLLRGDGPVPLIDLAMALAPRAGMPPAWQRYAPDSAFPVHFFREAVDVTAITILGEQYALPSSEVEDVIPCQPWRAVPAPDIVAGITAHGGEVLPVVDLARIFGRRSLATGAWRMLLVSNGDFRALVVTETVAGEKRLPPDVHRAMPVHLPHGLMYGCYPDGIAARVILNVAAIAVHFDRALIQQFMPTLSEQMKASPTGTVHTFADEEDVAPTSQQATPAPVVAAETGAAQTGTGATQAGPTQAEPPTAGRGPLLVVAESEHAAAHAPDIAKTRKQAIEHPTETQQAFPAGRSHGEVHRIAEAANAPSYIPPHEPAVQPATHETAAAAATSAAEERMPEPVDVGAGRETHAQPHREEHMQAAHDDARIGGGSLRYGLAAFAALLATALLYFEMPAGQPNEQRADPAAPVRAVSERKASGPVASAPPLATTPGSAEPISTRTPIVPPRAAEIPAGPLVLEVPANVPIEAELYVVKRGDTLWSIAQRLTGNPYNYPRIAGSNAIANPDLIFPGQQIRLVKRD